MRLVINCLLFIFSVLPSFSQNGFWIELRQKKDSGFDPSAYFHPKAIERRIINNVAINDSTDWPVHADYEHIISQYADTLIYSSRWLNACYVHGDFNKLQGLLQYSFVSKIHPSYFSLELSSYQNSDSELVPDEMERLALKQIKSMSGEFFQKDGITGKGVRIAVFDAGFPEVNTHFVLKHLIANKQIERTFDFTRRREHAYRGNSHGLSTLSNIAGKHGEISFGLAPDATFMLAITEVSSEIFKEEVWWVAAAEWADKHGAQIINSSLGYTYHRYFPEQMNGEVAYISRAANMAADKGILIVNSAGNEGDSKKWRLIGAPADAEKVLSIGGTQAGSNTHISFGSYGPTSDGRMKPNVSAPGYAAGAGTKNRVKGNYGTSFSSPLVAGFAACVLQKHPEYSREKLFIEIQKSGHLYPYFDYAIGYGVPQASYFYGEEKDEISFSAELTSNGLFVKILDNANQESEIDDSKQSQENNSPQQLPEEETELIKDEQEEMVNQDVDWAGIVRKLEFGDTRNEFLFFHVADENNRLIDYKVYSYLVNDEYLIPTYNYPKNVTFRLHKGGHTITIKNQ